MADFTCKRGQTSRTMVVTATVVNTGLAVDLTGYKDLAVVCVPEGGGTKFSLPVNITSTANGEMTRTFSALDFPRAGVYRANVEGISPSDGIVKWPDAGYLTLEVQEGIS